jgi:2-keto-4-pentenoate hydratase/2-oxohepta-3-ene-1,7-dioic acid hydratase in catechol pathway
MSLLVSSSVGIGRVVGDAVHILETAQRNLGQALQDGVTVDMLATLPVREQLSRDECRVLAPVPRPAQIWALGLAYMDHVNEAQRPPDAEPFFFPKAGSSVIASRDPIRLPAIAPAQVDYEGEVAVVIGRTAARISAENAWSYVAGITICNDVSARDVQLGGNGVRPNVSMAKSFDTFTPMGPVLATLDEFRDVDDIGIKTYVDGELRQNARTSQLIRPVPEILAFLTARVTLHPGDVVSTGTPAGVGHPQGRFLRDGSTVRIEVEHVGVLENPVRVD